jgi:hypothetical protein
MFTLSIKKTPPDYHHLLPVASPSGIKLVDIASTDKVLALLIPSRSRSCREFENASIVPIHHKTPKVLSSNVSVN